ncbi:MAG: ZIP family metal transporter [Deltaproteobacteria bacterium]|nr:ZIP family metal transporter [Deltaproteobacteria bacterium]
MLLTLITVFSLLGSVGAIAFAGFFLLFPERTRAAFIPGLISYASGTLLGAAFLGLIPNAVSRLEAPIVLKFILAGVLLFFVLEKLILWHHCHGEQCESRETAGPLLLIGDAFHNFVDGVIIAAAFIISTPLGITTALAVIAHELPQEVGDFGVLLDSGYTKQKAFLLNTLSSITTLPGALLAYFYLTEVQGLIPYVMALSAASFIYIAMVDLIPSLHRKAGLATGIRQFALMLAGVATITLFHLH